MTDGADSYGEVAAGLAVVARRTGQQASGEAARQTCASGWDKRPGALEATKGLPALLVAARRGLRGWRVWISATAQGPHALTPGEARKLAGELIEYAYICECDPGTVPALRYGSSPSSAPPQGERGVVG